MPVTVFYKGKLKQPDDISDFKEIVLNKIKEHGWKIYELDSKFPNIAIAIPECEPLSFVFKQGKVDSFAKYIGTDSSVLEDIFDTLRAVKPFFKRLTVVDEYGAWEQYISQYNKDKFPPFRELKDIEKSELKRWFDLPKGSNSIFGMNLSKAVLMFMICKDMSDTLDIPKTKSSLLSDIDKRIFRVPQEVEEKIESFQFIVIVENWFLTTLSDKNGNAIKHLPDKLNGFTLFANFMSEMILGGSSGSLGSKHVKLYKYVDFLTAQGYDFDNEEIFLRLVYSVMEYLGGYRSNELISRTK